MDRTRTHSSGSSGAVNHTPTQGKPDRSAQPASPLPSVGERVSEPSAVSVQAFPPELNPAASTPQIASISRQAGTTTEAGPSNAQRRTGQIKEAMLRYFLDPKLQLADMRERVDGFYRQNPALATLRNLALDLIRNGNLPKLAETEEDMFCCMLAAELYLMRIDEALPAWSQSRLDFDPTLIKIAGKWANLLISPLVLAGQHPTDTGTDLVTNQVRDEAMDTGQEILAELKKSTHDSSEARRKHLLELASSLDISPANEELGEAGISAIAYPVILRGSLGLYPHEASILAYSEGFSLLGMLTASFGVHGGMFKSPLAIYMHDLLHELDMLGPDGNRLAGALARGLCKNFLAAIDDCARIDDGNTRTRETNQRAVDFFAAHLLVHESGPHKIWTIDSVKRCPSPAVALDVLYEAFVEDLALTLGVEGDAVRTMRYAVLPLPDAKSLEQELSLIGDPPVGVGFYYDDCVEWMRLNDSPELESSLVPGIAKYREKSAEQRAQLFEAEGMVAGIGPLSKAGSEAFKRLDREEKEFIAEALDRKQVFLTLVRVAREFRDRMAPRMSNQPVDMQEFEAFLAKRNA